jgi:hypothetical protein
VSFGQAATAMKPRGASGIWISRAPIVGRGFQQKSEEVPIVHGEDQGRIANS